MEPTVHAVFKKLLSLLGVDPKIADRINISLFSDNRKYEIKDSVINIDLTKFSKQEKEEFLSAMKRLRESDDDYLVMENKSYELTQNIFGLKEDFDVIKKFEGVLSPEDFAALEDSIYIDYLHKKEKHEELARRKQQIIRQFGERGNMICKLYTAGYFHGIFIPLYDELLKNENGLEEFKLTFDKLIRDFPLAIFINRFMSVEEVKTMTKNKIINNQNTGLRSCTYME